MAAINTLTLRESWRKKIATSQLINRLSKHALADTDIMTASQIKAAEILLRKTFPDLQVNEISGVAGKPIEVTVRPILTKDDWLKTHGLGTAIRAAK